MNNTEKFMSIALQDVKNKNLKFEKTDDKLILYQE